MLLGYQFVASILFGDIFIRNPYYVLMINQVLIGSFAAVYCILNRIDIRETFRIRKLEIAPALLIVLLAVPLYLGAVMLNGIVIYGLQFIAELPKQTLPALETPSDLAVGIAIVAVMPGICEELLHRGLLLTAYERRGSTGLSLSLRFCSDLSTSISRTRQDLCCSAWFSAITSFGRDPYSQVYWPIS